MEHFVSKETLLSYGLVIHTKLLFVTKAAIKNAFSTVKRRDSLGETAIWLARNRLLERALYDRGCKIFLRAIFTTAAS